MSKSQHLNLDQGISSPTSPQQSVGQAELQDNTDQAEATEQIFFNDDSKDTNGAEQLNFEQETSSPTCPQQSVDRAEFQDNPDQIEVSVPENAQESDIVTETQDAPQVKEGNDLNGLDFEESCEVLLGFKGFGWDLKDLAGIRNMRLGFEIFGCDFGYLAGIANIFNMLLEFFISSWDF